MCLQNTNYSHVNVRKHFFCNRRPRPADNAMECTTAYWYIEIRSDYMKSDKKFKFLKL